MADINRPWRNLYYLAAWKRIRAVRLRNDPLCAMCSTTERPVAAAICDHIKPHRGNRQLFFDYDNTQSLCKLCHDSTKQRLETVGEIGCDDAGNPLDPDHPWYREG